MDIIGTINKLDHKPLLQKKLRIVNFEHFDINSVPASFIINDEKYSYAISKWVSPKRTRSYPFERVYNTWNITKKITVIPIVKDEGIKGDRDYIQWDTVSLMSLLDVYVIFAYYSKAEKSAKIGKITNQRFDNEFIKLKIREIEESQLSPLNWNSKEFDPVNFISLVDKVKTSYKSIEKVTGVSMHDFKGIEKFRREIEIDSNLFKIFSRNKSSKAQAREYVTIQPKERLSGRGKAKITIEDHLGGQYFLTVDEVEIDKEKKEIQLIECKHSKSSVLPSKADIKDGLLKMALYSSLYEITVDGISMKYKAVLLLSSCFIQSEMSSNNTDDEIRTFLLKNKFKRNHTQLIHELIAGARENNITIVIKYYE